MTSDFRARLRQRAGAGLTLEPPILSRLEAYHRLLTHWNRRINLTSLQLDPISEQALDRLFVEPLVAAKYIPDVSLDWFDLGSGGGSPAFPIRIVRPSARLTLIEARSRKAAFLREVARELELAGVEVVNERLEAITSREALGASADLVTVRAVKADQALGKTVRHILRDDGRLLLFSTPGAANTLRIAGLIQSTSSRLAAAGHAELLIFQRDVPRSS